MPPNTLLLHVETILQHHQTEIDKNKDDISKTRDIYHQLDKNLIALRADLKNDRDVTRQEMLNLSNKIDQLSDNSEKLEKLIKEQTSCLKDDINKTSERVDALEDFHNTRQWWLNAILKVLKSLAKLWWLWLLIIVSFFAFDVEFKVKNPHLVSMLVQVVQRKL
jgi:chromosome segregation ATPase